MADAKTTFKNLYEACLSHISKAVGRDGQVVLVYGEDEIRISGWADSGVVNGFKVYHRQMLIVTVMFIFMGTSSIAPSSVKAVLYSNTETVNTPVLNIWDPISGLSRFTHESNVPVDLIIDSLMQIVNTDMLIETALRTCINDFVSSHQEYSEMDMDMLDFLKTSGCESALIAFVSETLRKDSRVIVHEISDKKIHISMTKWS